MSPWQARYLDGKTSASQKVEVQALEEWLEIRLPDRTRRVWPYSEIRQVQGSYAGEPVRLERGGDTGEALVVDDTEFLNELRARAPRQALRFHNPGFRRTRVWLTFGAGLATLALGLVAWKWGIPLLAETLTPRVPVSWEESLGESEIQLMAPAKNRVHNPRLDQALQKIVDRLARTVPHCPYRFHVTVCDLPVFNAFALPGGNIVVFQPLLKATRTPEELAGVLAHEMQHVLRRHSTKRLIQQSSLGLLISALSGDATGSAAFALQSAGNMALMSYSRGEEEEADLEGMKMILAAGIRPQGMIDFFRTLQKRAKEPQFLKFVSDHPSTGDRIQKLQDLVALEKPPVPATALLPGTDWTGLMAGLKGSKEEP